MTDKKKIKKEKWKMKNEEEWRQHIGNDIITRFLGTFFFFGEMISRYFVIILEWHIWKPK